MTERMIYIYSLIDPRTDEVRYIGKTNDLKGRLHEHALKRDSATHKAHWVNQLRAAGLRPCMEVLEETTEAHWEERERYWIAYGKAQGWRLTNIREGGNPTKNEMRATAICGTVGDALALYVSSELRSVYAALSPEDKLSIGQDAARAILPLFDQVCRVGFRGSTDPQDNRDSHQAYLIACDVVNSRLRSFGSLDI